MKLVGLSFIVTLYKFGVYDSTMMMTTTMMSYLAEHSVERYAGIGSTNHENGRRNDIGHNGP